MRNLGVILLVVGLLLLILPNWFIYLVGVVSALSGLLTIIFPDQASNFINKFSSKKESKE